MITKIEQIAFSEVAYVIDNIEEPFKSRIPLEVRALFKENSIKIESFYDKNGELKLSELAQKILCYLNLEYWCSEQEKKKLLKIYEQNENKLQEQYDIYKKINQRNMKKEISTSTNNQLTEFKENFILKFIKKIFKRRSRLNLLSNFNRHPLCDVSQREGAGGSFFLYKKFF